MICVPVRQEHLQTLHNDGMCFCDCMSTPNKVNHLFTYPPLRRGGQGSRLPAREDHCQVERNSSNGLVVF